MADPIRITADEINCLIHSYFQDSGFTHSAFSLCSEGRLQQSPHFGRHIPRGELVELLSKALLYLEVESHWRADAITMGCKTGFSLLQPHVCSSEPAPPRHILPIAAAISDAAKVNGTDSHTKRKASPVTGDGPSEKRTRRDPDDMDVDSSSESSKARVNNSETAISRNLTPEPLPKKKAKPGARAQGPGDDVTNPNAILLLPGHKTEIFVCAFNPVKPSVLATGSKDAVVNLWTLPDSSGVQGDAIQRPGPPILLDHFSKVEQGDLTSLHWNSEGTLLAIGSYDSILRICTVAGEIYFSHHQHKGPIFATRFSKSGRWLLTASLDGTACLWDVKGKRLQKQFRHHSDCCLDVDWMNDNMFGSCGADHRIHIMRIDEDDPVKTLLGHTNEINQIKFNSSGTRLASCSDDMTARVWNVDNISSSADSIPGLSASEHVVVLEGHKHSVSTVGWCPHHPPGTNQMIATSSFDGTARLWDSVTGECLKILNDHKRPVYTLSFCPSGRWFATGSGDGWLHVYSVKGKDKKWSWYAGPEKPGVFEIDWQEHGGLNRIALALECRQVAVIDVHQIPALREE